MDEVGNIYRTVEFGGWDLHSFINQNGTIAENGQAVTIPVTASPITTVTTAPGLPKQVRVMQEWGQFNFLTANGGADAPGTAGSGGVQLWYGNGPTQSPATSVNQKTRTTTLWLGNYSLQPSRVERTLLGTELPNLRPGATAPLAIQTTNYYYDAKGRLTGTTTQLGTGFSQEARAYSGNNPQPDTVTQWAGLGSDLAHAVPLNFAGLAGKSYTYSPGPNFWLRTETDLLKGTTTYERDNLGRVTKTTDPNGVETTTTYDSWGRVYEVTRKAIGGIGPVTRRYTYEPNGLWTKTEVMAEGKTLASKTYLDAFGRVWKEEAADGGVRTTQYDGYGQKIAQSPWLRPGQTPYGNYTFTYDKKGRLVASKDPQGRTLSTAPADPAWDATAGGGITTTFDDRNYTRSSVTDLLGQQKSLTDPKGQTTTFTYDRFGRMNRMSLAGQNRVYAYDDLGHLVSRMEPEEGETVYGDYTVWGAPGRVQQKGLSGTSPVAILTNFDAKGRPNQVWDDQGNTFLRTIKYDPDYPDRVSQIEEYQADGSMQETYGYDAMGRLVQKTIVDDYRQEFSMSRTFDAMGNVTRLYYPVFGIVNFGYDAYFRPSTITKPGSQPVPVASMTYDQVDGTKVDSTLTFGNNATTVRSFDKGELTRITHTAVGLNDVNPMTWTAGGLLLSRGNDVFNYDELGRLSYAKTVGLSGEVHTQNFTYDAFGNRTQNQVANSGSGVIPAESLSWTATYGTDNHLPTQVQSPSGTLLTGAQYDDFGRLKQVWAIPGQVDSYTDWIYDSSGRMTMENGTRFLLDAQGLRFRRTKPDGTINYTVYGFNRDPLATFESAIQSPASAPMVAASKPAAESGAKTSPRRRAKSGSAESAPGVPYGQMRTVPPHLTVPERRTAAVEKASPAAKAPGREATPGPSAPRLGRVRPALAGALIPRKAS